MIIPSKTGVINGGFVESLRRAISISRLSFSRNSLLVLSRKFTQSMALATCLCVVALALGTTSPAQAEPTWGAVGNGWSGSGSVYLPGGGHVGGANSSGGSGCQGCTWQVTPLCLHGIRNPCEPMPPYEMCGAGEFRYQILFGQGGAAPGYYGTECIGPGERPVSSVEIEAQVQDRVRQLAPSLSFSFQPSSRPVTQIPTIFRVNQANEVSRTDSIAGLSVQMSAQVNRVWQWGDGKSRQTNQQGGRWPDTSLSHTYREAGTKRVRLTANWRAEYSVNGGRWVEVDGDPVSQTTSQTLRVREARAQLVE